MNTIRLKSLLAAVVLALLTALPAVARHGLSDARRAVLMDSVERELQRSSVPRDRLRLTYDLCDLCSYHDLNPYLERLYKAAVAARDTAAIFDALRQRANKFTLPDSTLNVVLKTAEMMSVTPDQKETVTFIRLKLAEKAARTLNDTLRAEKLHELVMSFSDDKVVDIYRRIEMLGTLCTFLMRGTGGKFLFDYLNEMEEIIRRLPPEQYALRSYFYTTAANAAAAALRPREAVRYDRGLRKMMDFLEEKYRKAGHRFRIYDVYRYMSARRMLACYKALMPKEIEDLYAMTERLTAANKDVADDVAKNRFNEGIHALANGDYALAVTCLSQAAANMKGYIIEPLVLQALIEAATKTGDKQALLAAYQQYVPLMEKRAADLDEDRILEYQILHNLAELRAANTNLAADIHRSEVSKRRAIVTVSVIGMAILVILLIWLMAAYARARRLLRRHDELNKQLLTERDNLKTAHAELVSARDAAREAERRTEDFVTTFSHEISEPANAIIGYSQLIIDSVEDSRRAVLERFLKIVELNGNFLKTMVCDVLDAAELDTEHVVLRRLMFSMKEAVDYAVASVSMHPHEGVTVEVRSMEGTPADAMIETDQSRCTQVLINLINNAYKFTHEGSVHILYGVDREANRAMFVVEDTGPGIPADKREAVFNRFEKVSKSSPGVGLGLFVARRVARLLGGDVVLENTSRRGSRFVFTLPLTAAGSDTAHLAHL